MGKTKKPNRLIISVARASKWRLPTEQETVAAAGVYSGGSNWSSTNVGVGTFGTSPNQWSLPAAGDREASEGVVYYQGVNGYFWSSSVLNSIAGSAMKMEGTQLSTGFALIGNAGLSVRCTPVLPTDAPDHDAAEAPLLPGDGYSLSVDYHGNSEIPFSTTTGYFSKLSWSGADWFHAWNGDSAVSSGTSSDLTRLSIEPWLLSLTDNYPSVQTRSVTPLLSSSAATGSTGFAYSLTQTSPVWNGWKNDVPAEIPNTGGSFDISVSTNASWSVRVLKPDNSSQTLTPSGGKVSVVVDDNSEETDTDRTWNVFLTCDALSGYTSEGSVGSYLQKGATGSAPPPTYDGAYVIYFADGGLKLGKWGVDVLRIDQLVLFKFGSVIGISNPVNGTAWNNNQIIYNPTPLVVGTDITGYGNNTGALPAVPGYVAADWNANRKNTSDRTNYHTAANLAVGKGDPCQLVGFTGKTGAAAFAHQSGWRLPTNAENVAFTGGLAHGQEDAAGKYLVGTINSAGAVTLTPSVNSSPGWTTTNTSSTKIGLAEFPGGTPAGIRLPAAGWRHYSTGDVGNQGNHGYYWSSIPIDIYNGGGGLYLTPGNVDPAITINSACAVSVRCVPK